MTTVVSPLPSQGGSRRIERVGPLVSNPSTSRRSDGLTWFGRLQQIASITRTRPHAQSYLAPSAYCRHNGCCCAIASPFAWAAVLSISSLHCSIGLASLSPKMS